MIYVGIYVPAGTTGVGRGRGRRTYNCTRRSSGDDDDIHLVEKRHRSTVEHGAGAAENVPRTMAFARAWAGGRARLSAARPWDGRCVSTADGPPSRGDPMMHALREQRWAGVLDALAGGSGRRDMEARARAAAQAADAATPHQVSGKAFARIIGSARSGVARVVRRESRSSPSPGFVAVRK